MNKNSVQARAKATVVCNDGKDIAVIGGVIKRLASPATKGLALEINWPIINANEPPIKAPKIDLKAFIFNKIFFSLPSGKIVKIIIKTNKSQIKYLAKNMPTASKNAFSVAI